MLTIHLSCDKAKIGVQYEIKRIDNLLIKMEHYHSKGVTKVLTERLAHADQDNDKSSILVAKGVTMVVLCIVSICMGLVPLGFTKCSTWSSSQKLSNPRSSKIVGLLLGFGGGVLFCTTFLHMLPEVTENVQELTEHEKLPHLPFSLPEALVCFGFFIMYLVEECVHTRLRHRQASAEKTVVMNVNRSTNELVENGHSALQGPHGHAYSYGHGHNHLPSAVMENHDVLISSLRGLLIVLGLSVHELFEGLAIGLESSTSYVWYMFSAVAAHKFVIAFCIGIELITSRTNRFLTVVYVCTFAIVSPLGIGIGMALTGSDTTATSGPLAVILQGIATGTLLYVVFFEILQHHRDGLHQYLSILFGFAVMCGLQIATSHSHSHSHGPSHGGDEINTDEHLHDDVKDHNHSDHTNVSPINEAIGRITGSVVEAVSSAIASSTAMRSTFNTSNLSDEYSAPST